MSNAPNVLVIMGSKSDWETMQETAKTLKQFGIPYEAHVASAHRCPDKVVELCQQAEGRGVRVIIAAAGGAAHLAGVCAASTHLPILGVPMKGWSLDGMDSLLSTVQMPSGIPVATFAIGKAGAINAAICAAQILGTANTELRDKVIAFRKAQTEKVLGDDNLVLP